MRSSYKAKKPTSDFESLVRNGIDFLEKAMIQLDSDPKHSVINFYTAVEIFLKAPLVHEHWSLVVVDRDPNRHKYETGDFLSVTFDDACTRLSTSLNKPLPKSAKDSFNKVRKHRNRMVHFYHSGLDGKQRDDIKLEQAQAWFELNRFITDTWREQFKPFSSNFRRMERSLIANNHYAKAKYEDLKPKIEGMKKSGSVFESCPRCKTDAYQVEDEAPRLIFRQCMICFNYDRRIQVDCPKCDNSNQYIEHHNGFMCEKCDHTLSGEGAIYDLIDQSILCSSRYDFDSITPANCDECQSYESVCDYEGGYLCSNCFAYFESIGNCEWCNSSMTGNTEDTYVTGCEHCDGYADYHADD